MRCIAFYICFTLAQLSFAGPPKFEPERLFDMPKPAAMIESEVQKDLERSKKNIFVFDVHGIFTQELVPSADGNVKLNNRFIPLLKNVVAKNARIMAVSAHDKPDILYSELHSLRYGNEKGEELLADFMRGQQGDRENGFMLLPFKNGDFKLIQFNRLGNVVSAGIPNARYNTEKAAAVLFHLLSQETLKALSVSPALYEKMETGVRDLSEQIAGVVAARAGKFYPLKCTSWTLIETVKKALVDLSHTETNVESVLSKLNNVVERKVCGVVKAGLTTYPHGKPSKEQKDALKAELRDDASKLLAERKKMQDQFNPKDLQRAREELVAATAGVQLFYLEDAIENLDRFQQDIIASGYFEDATIVLEHALLPEKDKQFTHEELEQKISGGTPEKKRSIEGIKNSTEKK